MEEITFLHWWKDNGYKSEVYGVPTGIILHGGASDWALMSYKAMVNDTIPNALDIFPVQKYDWRLITQK